jgi:hypothetical protein
MGYVSSPNRFSACRKSPHYLCYMTVLEKLTLQSKGVLVGCSRAVRVNTKVAHLTA